MLPNTELGVNLQRNEGDTFEEYTDRVAVHTLFAAHDRGLRFEDRAIAIAAIMRRLCQEEFSSV